MKIRPLILSAGLLSAAVCANAQLQVNIDPISSFGGGDGWLAPGEVPWLGTGSLERGMAYWGGNVYVASRNGSNAVHILNKSTGAEVGYLNMNGVTGGTLVMNMISVAGDGSIYLGNLVTSNSGTSPFKIYKWSDWSSVPTVAYSGEVLNGARVGDSMDVTGTGASTRLVVGYGTGKVGYGIIDPTAGTSVSVGFSGTTVPGSGDFRLGITFTDSGHVYGSEGETLAHYSEFSDNAGTLLGSAPLTTSAERPMDWAVIAGRPLLATLSTGDSRVRVYDATDPLALALLATSEAPTNTAFANANATGAIAWGDISSPNAEGHVTAELFALNSNNGVQAFTVTIVPEPSSLALVALGLCALALRRRV